MEKDGATRLSGDRLAVGLVFLYSVLWFGWVGRSGIGHAYYSGSARSLAGHPRLWFSGAFDPGGFVTVDKPPIGLWLTAVTVRLFGPNPFGFVLPGAILSWLAGWFTSRTVAGPGRRWVWLGVLVTPGVAVLARSSLPDATMLAAGCAAAAVFVSGWTRRPHLVAGVLLAVALLAKPGAVLMIPAFIVFAVVDNRISWRQFLGFAVAALAVLGAWVLAASATPDRPYFGGTNNDTAIELLVGRASVSRVVDADLTVSGDKWIGISSAGEPGPLRILAGRMGRQAGFLLVFAALAGVSLIRNGPACDRCVAAFWLCWLVTHVVVYSALPGIAHAYYVASLAPPIAALTVMSVRSNQVDWLTLVGLGVSLFVTFHLASSAEPLRNILAIPGLVVFAAVAYFFARRLDGTDPAIVACVLGIGLAMAIVSGHHLVIERDWSFDPAAGDEFFASGDDNETLIDLLSTTSAKWALATDDEALASRLVANEGLSVMLVGGFLSRDPIVTEQELAGLIGSGLVGFVTAPVDVRSPGGQVLATVQELCEPLRDLEGVRECR